MVAAPAGDSRAGVTLVGHGVSCYMMRQMEFDADSYEVKIAGADAFTQTMIRLRELSAGSQIAYRQLPQRLERQRSLTRGAGIRCCLCLRKDTQQEQRQPQQYAAKA